MGPWNRDKVATEMGVVPRCVFIYGSMPLYFRQYCRGANLVGAWAGTVTFSESAKFSPSE
jgi:hypothetical protein